MVILRCLAPVSKTLQLFQRFYTRKTVTTTDANMKQVHQETLRYISPHASIKIDSDIYLKVSSADPHKYPNGNALIAELRGGHVKNSTASMEVQVSDDESQVKIVLRKLTENTDFHCELAVPIKASLDIDTRYAAIVTNTFGDDLKVKAVKFINTKNVRSENIQLLCSEGDIKCQGILLGKETYIETQNKGSILLDKLQGDQITCKTSQGNITANCSYVETSKFETDNGCLDLKNVHKKAVVVVHEKGDLKMTGVHGNLNVFINEGVMNLQLSELQGENTIESHNLTSSIINISEDIEKTTSLNVRLTGDAATSAICLDSALKHLSVGLAENKKQFKWPLDQELPNKLKVVSKTSLTLGKSSWMEMLRIQMSGNLENKS